MGHFKESSSGFPGGFAGFGFVRVMHGGIFDFECTASTQLPDTVESPSINFNVSAVSSQWDTLSVIMTL